MPNDMVGKETVNQLVERGIVEIAPLAYMRGRTLSNAFVVLDIPYDPSTNDDVLNSTG